MEATGLLLCLSHVTLAKGPLETIKQEVEWAPGLLCMLKRE